MGTAFAAAIIMLIQRPVGASAKRSGARINTSRTPPIYRPSSIGSMMVTFTRHCALVISTQRSATPQEGKP